MNQLTANFKWKKKMLDITSGECEFILGILRLCIKRINVHIFGNNNYFYNPSTNTIVAIVGYISNIEQICDIYSTEPDEDVRIIERIYSSNGLKFMSDLEGVFTILIWDEAR